MGKIKEIKNIIKKASEEESSYYVGLVIMNPLGQVLLGKRKEDSLWTGPGGGSDIGETPKQTAIRESFEESQVEINPERLIELDTLKARNGKPVFCYLYITGNLNTDVNLDPDSEVNSWKWFSPEEIPKDLAKDVNRHKTVLNGIMRFKGLKKGMSLSELSGINVDTSDYAISDMSARRSEWYNIIREAMANFELGEVSRTLPLGVEYELSCRQEDDGIYSGEVRCIDKASGEYGMVLHKIIKKPLADLIQELKLKEFISEAEQETELPEIEPEVNPEHVAAEKIEDIVEEHEEEAEILGESSQEEAQADLEMYDRIKDVIRDAETIDEERQKDERVSTILSTILSIADLDSRPVNINIHLAKAKAAQVGEIHIYNGKKYQKQSDGTWKPYQSPRAKGIEATKQGKKKPREIDRGVPHSVEMTIEIEGQTFKKQYDNIHGENKKLVELDILDKLERTLGKQGTKFSVKDMKVTKQEDTKKAWIPEIIDLIKGGKRAAIGEVRKWGKYNFVKRADGWHYQDGPHAGKPMGSVRSSKKKEAPKDNTPKDLKATTEKFKQKAQELKAQNKKRSEERKEKISAITDEFLKEEGLDKPKKPKLPEKGKIAPTALLGPEVKTKDGEKELRIRGLSTGKPSAVPYKSPAGTNTNMIGTVSFGKSSKEVQTQLNQQLFDTEILIDDLDITFKKPVDFVCQNVKDPKRTQATYTNLKDRFDANDRIDIKDRQSGLGKSIVHEVGHALDYSLTEESEGKLSFFEKLKRQGSKETGADKKDFDRMQELLKEAPFYQERSDKSYLSDPTEIFARGFEVYAYDRALNLHSEGKISDEFIHGFHPDFLKSKESLTALRGIKSEEIIPKLEALGETDLAAKLKPLVKQNQENVARFQAIRGELNDLVSQELKDKSDSEARAQKVRQLRDEGRNLVGKNKKLARQMEKLEAEAFTAIKNSIGLRSDEAEIRSEIVGIMDRILKNNPIKKALQLFNITRIIKENSEV